MNAGSKRRARVRGRKRSAGVAGPIERFLALSDDEKERIWESYNDGVSFAETRPLSKTDRQRWEKAKKRMGRPKVGKGAKVISLSVEGGLLERADAYARKHSISRTQLFARSVERMLAAG